jgi:imidazolonepropionase-like amidohydrolase
VVPEGQSTAENRARFNVIEGAGKTMLPGLIDAHAHLGGPPVITGSMEEEFSNWQERAIKAYLYSGVTAVKSVGDATDDLLLLRERFRSAELLGAEVFMTGPLFTAPGGHGTEYFKSFPEMARLKMEPQMAAAYSTPSEAVSRVDTLAAQGVDGIKVVIEAGGQGALFERLDLNIFDKVVEAAARHNLPVVVHTGNIQDIRDASARKIAGLEHGAMRDLLPPDLLAELAAKSIRYDPTLSVLDSIVRLSKKDTSALEDPLVRQTVSGELLGKMRDWIRNNELAPALASIEDITATNAARNLKAAYDAKVPLALGTDAGNPGVFHGPAVHREMEIWKAAGIPAEEILKAATFGAATLLGASGRIGKVAKDYEANLLLVDGNPLQDISVTRRISDVFFKGERVRRSTLF